MNAFIFFAVWMPVATRILFAQDASLRRPDDASINSLDRNSDAYNATSSTLLSTRRKIKHSTFRRVAHRDHIYIATVVCDKAGGNLAMLFKVLLYSIAHHKSADTEITLMVVYDQNFTPKPDVLLCDDDALGPMTNDFKLYLATFNVVVEFYPTVVNEFLDKYGRCASTKLWIHDILHHVELAIVLDVDTFFLESPRHLWDSFFNSTAFNQTTIYGAVQEDVHAGSSFGVNNGVLLVNLTRARLVNMTSKWLEIYYHVPAYSTYTFFDQDMLNVYLSQNLDHFYELPCKWNQRAALADAGNHCPDLSLPLNGGLIHGNNRLFVTRSYNHFRARMHDVTQHHRLAFFFYLSSIKSHPHWCMQNSAFSHDDIKIEIGRYGRPPPTWVDELGFWFRWKGGLYTVLCGALGIALSGMIFFRLLARRDTGIPSSGALVRPPTSPE